MKTAAIKRPARTRTMAIPRLTEDEFRKFASQTELYGLSKRNVIIACVRLFAASQSFRATVMTEIETFAVE